MTDETQRGGSTNGTGAVDPAVPPRLTATLRLLERRRSAQLADAAAAADVGAIVALGLMFAVEVPKGGPYVFGTTNDVLGVGHFLLVPPVMVELSAELPAGAARDVVLPVGLAGSVLGAVSGTLLVARVLPFAPSTALSLAAMELQATWMLVTNDRLRASGRLPAGLSRLGTLIGAGMLGGGALAGLARLLPAESTARRLLNAAGLAPMTAAWVAWPAWLHLVARYLRQTPRRR